MGEGGEKESYGVWNLYEIPADEQGRIMLPYGDSYITGNGSTFNPGNMHRGYIGGIKTASGIYAQRSPDGLGYFVSDSSSPRRRKHDIDEKTLAVAHPSGLRANGLVSFLFEVVIVDNHPRLIVQPFGDRVIFSNGGVAFRNVDDVAHFQGVDLSDPILIH